MRKVRVSSLWLSLSTACPTGDSAGDAVDTGSSGTVAMTPPEPPEPTTSGTASTDGPGETTTGTGETGSTGSGSTGVATGDPSRCGDGVVDPGEACDLGLDNSDAGYCKHDCTLAVCGDGELWIGVEQCDDPGGNDGSFGGCEADCTFAAYCGDGMLHVSESCDAGPLNGTGEHEDGFVACSATCGLEARRMFVSSQAFAGDLGGLGGADLRCRNLAAAAGWSAPETVYAWLADGASSPPSRFVETAPSLPFALVNGRRVADDLADLVAQGPDVGIGLDEQGASWANVYVWTNTGVAGGVFSGTDHCAGWVSTNLELFARTGVNAVAEDDMADWSQTRAWTSKKALTCDRMLRLYCLEL